MRDAVRHQGHTRPAAPVQPRQGAVTTRFALVWYTLAAGLIRDRRRLRRGRGRAARAAAHRQPGRGRARRQRVHAAGARLRTAARGLAGPHPPPQAGPRRATSSSWPPRWSGLVCDAGPGAARLVPADRRRRPAPRCRSPAPASPAWCRSLVPPAVLPRANTIDAITFNGAAIARSGGRRHDRRRHLRRRRGAGDRHHRVGRRPGHADAAHAVAPGPARGDEPVGHGRSRAPASCCARRRCGAAP